MTSETVRWRRSSRSGPDNNCAEVARVGDGHGGGGSGSDSGSGGVLVRDSKCPDGGVLEFPGASWAGFLASLRR
ncbi:DUF397 domain-containing protein [Actinosynnema mirum]|uniref:DUF397 domain-containing protein n=1 Tax=Actinosynnema mirum (strain ATCC 29888 / DSM 43827 / JCM 3225 / NBRC 14064 / NCIMB 13271 / NRRL B-12336 / IMRU 3971 / 101) TaxID=446462 RepID=C6WS39_ACTMD|nr:DUF397 domain-containing protein [Actinosynnema mirum]ACU38859.1 protein of unknown function DUF397 [Actinosynnema mirum DSM 43827]